MKVSMTKSCPPPPTPTQCFSTQPQAYMLVVRCNIRTNHFLIEFRALKAGCCENMDFAPPPTDALFAFQKGRSALAAPTGSRALLTSAGQSGGLLWLVRAGIESKAPMNGCRDRMLREGLGCRNDGCFQISIRDTFVKHILLFTRTVTKVVELHRIRMRGYEINS